MLETSYFSSKAPRERKVSIAKWPPRFWKGARASKLAPSDPKAENWEAAYQRDLEQRFPNGLGLQEYLADIEVATPNPILCCYEQNPNECHRSVLAKYAKKHIGLNLKEWESDAPKQGSLLD